jgi:hypothetical protein
MPIYCFDYRDPPYFEVRYRDTKWRYVSQKIYVAHYPSRLAALDAAAALEVKTRRRVEKQANRVAQENAIALRAARAIAPAAARYLHAPTARNTSGAVGIACRYAGNASRSPILLITAQWMEEVPGQGQRKMRKVAYSTRRYGLRGAIELALQARQAATGLKQPSFKVVWAQMQHHLPPVPGGGIDEARERWLAGEL